MCLSQKCALFDLYIIKEQYDVFVSAYNVKQKKINVKDVNTLTTESYIQLLFFCVVCTLILTKIVAVFLVTRCTCVCVCLYV